VPADPVKAAQVEQWVSIVNTHIDPLWLRQYLRAYVFPAATAAPSATPSMPRCPRWSASLQ
jgi:hypothetical protein